MSGYVNITWAVTCPHCGEVYYLDGMEYTLNPSVQYVTCPECRQVHRFVRHKNAVPLDLEKKGN